MNNRVIKAKKGTTEVLTTVGKLKCNSARMLFKIFDIQIVPLLLNAPEIWGLNQIVAVKKIHLLSCKRLLRVLIKSSNKCMVIPSYTKSAITCIKYWLRLLKLQLTKYAKHMTSYICRISEVTKHGGPKKKQGFVR